MEDEVNRYLGVVQAIEAGGDAQHITFRPHQHSVAFAMSGGDIMSGDMTSQQSVTSPSGAPIVQGTDRGDWGTNLAFGSYQSLVKFGMHDYCFRVTTGGLTTPIGFFGGVYQIVGQL